MSIKIFSLPNPLFSFGDCTSNTHWNRGGYAWTHRAGVCVAWGLMHLGTNEVPSAHLSHSVGTALTRRLQQVSQEVGIVPAWEVPHSFTWYMVWDWAWDCVISSPSQLKWVFISSLSVVFERRNHVWDECLLLWQHKELHHEHIAWGWRAQVNPPQAALRCARLGCAGFYLWNCVDFFVTETVFYQCMALLTHTGFWLSASIEPRRVFCYHSYFVVLLWHSL